MFLLEFFDIKFEVVSYKEELKYASPCCRKIHHESGVPIPEFVPTCGTASHIIVTSGNEVKFGGFFAGP